MINLLPQKEKMKLAREHRLRLAVVVCCAILIIEIFCVVFFLPIYFNLYFSTQDIRTVITQQKALIPEDAEKAKNEGALIKQDISVLKMTENATKTLPTTIISELLADKPKGIDIISISYSNEKGPVTVQVSGIAATRDELLIFQKSLKNNEKVADVKSSGEFIIQKTNINFSFTITLKQ